MSLVVSRCRRAETHSLYLENAIVSHECHLSLWRACSHGGDEYTPARQYSSFQMLRGAGGAGVENLRSQGGLSVLHRTCRWIRTALGERASAAGGDDAPGGFRFVQPCFLAPEPEKARPDIEGAVQRWRYGKRLAGDGVRRLLRGVWVSP